jgi:CDP-glucose 4,6-dehydratase
VAELVRLEARVIALVHHPDPQSEFYRSGIYTHTAVVQGQLEDYDFLERTVNKYEVDTVLHLGAQAIVGVAHRSPLATFEANIRGTYNLLEVCRQHRSLVRGIVVASSDKAYGTQVNLPYTEAMPLQGVFPYEVSKSCADMISHSYYATYRLPVAVARCGNIYGGGDLNWSRIVPETIRACLRGQPPQIRSDGTFVRDYIYVKDVVYAYLRLAESLNDERVLGQAFNFSPFQPLSVLELVSNILRLMDSGHLIPQILNSAEGEIHSQYLDSSKAKTILNWQPLYDLEQGLRETIAWYRHYLLSEGTLSTV